MNHSPSSFLVGILIMLSSVVYSQTNVALNKPVVVTSTQGSFYASNAVDGNNDTRWVSQSGTPQSIEIDLQGDYEINQIVLNTYAVTPGFQLQYWDGGNWITGFTTTTNYNDPFVLNFSPLVTSKVKIIVTDGGSYGDNARIVEFEIYGEESSIEGGNSEPSQNIALNKTVSVSSQPMSRYAKGNAVDGNPSTRWVSSPGEPHELEIDLGMDYELNQLVVETYKETDSYIIEAWNNSMWNTIVSVSGNNQDRLTHNLTPITASRLRLSVSNGGWNKRARIEEFEIYGTSVNGGGMNFPGTLEAENYTDMFGVSTLAAGGHILVVDIDQNDWMEYNVSVPSPGTYLATFRVSGAENIEFNLKANDNLLTTISTTPTGGPYDFKEVSMPITVDQGTQTFRIESTSAEWSINWMSFEEVENVEPQQIPGTIEAESYSSMEGVEVKSFNQFTGVSNIDNNDWMEYHVSVDQAGQYLVRFIVSGYNTINFDFYQNGNFLDHIVSAATGNQFTLKEVFVPLDLQAGESTFKIQSNGSGWAIDRFEISSICLQNLALDQDASASSAATSPNLAIDGIEDYGYSWMSDSGFPQWLKIEFDKLHEVSMVYVNSGSGVLTKYDLEYWENGEWLKIQEKTNNTQAVTVNSFEPVETRKIRLMVHDALDNYFNNKAIVREIKVYSFPGHLLKDYQTICANETPVLKFTELDSEHSFTYQWQIWSEISEDWEDIAGATQNTYNPGQLTQGQDYRLLVSSDEFCGESFYLSASVKVAGNFELNTLGLSGGVTDLVNNEERSLTYNVGSSLDHSTNELKVMRFRNGHWQFMGYLSEYWTIKVRNGDKYQLVYDNPCDGTQKYSNELIINAPKTNNVPPSLDQNFVRIEAPKKPVISENELSLMDANEKTTSFQYFDGLGRTIMTSAAEAGPGYEDVVQYNYDYPSSGEDRILHPYTHAYNKPGSFDSDALGKTYDYYNSPPSGVANDATPYTLVEFENSPLRRADAVRGPGWDWSEADKKTRSDYSLNDSSTLVVKWKLNSSGNPVRDGVHANFTLQIYETTNEEDIISQTIVDSRGRNIATRTWYDDDGNGRWITTYYVYDVFNRLRWILPPLLSQKASLTENDRKNFAFEYKYDYRGRLKYEKNPGIEPVYYVYDRRNRLVYSQNGEQRNNDQWVFRKYDRYNRLIMTGIYNSNESQPTLETQLLNAGDSDMFENRNSSAHGYTTGMSFPKSNQSIWSITYFDDYTFTNHEGWDQETTTTSNDPFYYKSSVSNVSLPSSNHTLIKGLTTGSKVKLLGENKWLNTVIYYDDEYRAIQIVSENHVSGYDRISNQLDDYTGILEKMMLEHVGDESLELLSEYHYDHEFRLLQTYQQINSDPKVLVADYQYNALGQLIEKNLHSTDQGASYLQSVDYRYNIRGWLKSINNNQLSESESKANPDVFGAEYHYSQKPSINGNTNPRYDGSLAAMSWKADNMEGETLNRAAYDYRYDDLGQLTKAIYGAGNSDFDDAGSENHFNENPGYDDQGNITSMIRKSEGNTIDNLTYHYVDENETPGSPGDDFETNKLVKITDASGNEEGFNDRIPSAMPEEYEFDDNGNLTRDQHKAMSIVYNDFLQLPSAVNFDDGSSIAYTYDATGNRLSKTVTFADGREERIYYVGLIEYRNSEIYQVYTDEGRAFKQNGQFFYEYFITDHQGNNRAAFGILPERNVYKANMEEGSADGEFAFPTNDPRTTGENKTTGGTQSAHLNHAQNRSLGPAKVLTIKNTDVVAIDFWALYESATNTTGTFGDVVATLLSSFGYTSGDGGAGEALSNTLGAGGSDPYMPTSTTNPDDAPDAYLAYLFFDENYTYDASLSGFLTVDEQALGSYERYETPEMTFDKNGYLFVYLANETEEDQEVYFDDLKITHESPTANFKVSQINEYYPFGLLTKNSWRNPGYEDPGMLYQSYYNTYDSLTEYNDFFLRNYEPAIGRWMQNDPYSQFASPYLAMGNNPHMGVDPDGGWWHLLLGAAIGGYSAGVLSSGDFNPANWSSNDWGWAVGGAFGGAFLAQGFLGHHFGTGANIGVQNPSFSQQFRGNIERIFSQHGTIDGIHWNNGIAKPTGKLPQHWGAKIERTLTSVVQQTVPVLDGVLPSDWGRSAAPDLIPDLSSGVTMVDARNTLTTTQGSSRYNSSVGMNVSDGSTYVEDIAQNGRGGIRATNSQIESGTDILDDAYDYWNRTGTGVDILGADTRLPSEMMGGRISQAIYNSRALKVQEYLIRRGMPSMAIRILGRGMNTGQSGSQIYLRFRF
ncbi:discoidin domain-containing protein [Ekhidna sp.]|jgi:YD repeat-containing protein|uniref:discoidin domain-containing protein n=1 Tax=Ekhidna sp. TaxID=2608089 RepID=UPI0032ECBD5D